jgi:16S rRNA (cytosine967-C5)-methyltransferase
VLVPLQRSLLLAALDSVRPGGVVLYATCSPVLAETRDVVQAVLTARPEAVLEDARALLPEVPDADGPLPGTVQLWPHRHSTDAMFMALLRHRPPTSAARVT